MLIWNTVKGILVEKVAHHAEAIYKVAWNHKDNDLIATASKDGIW